MRPLVLLGVAAAAAAFAAASTRRAQAQASEPLTTKATRVLLAGDSIMVGTQAFVAPTKLSVASVGATLLAAKKQVGAAFNDFDALVVSGGLNDLAGGATAEKIVERAEAVWQLAKARGMRVAHLELTPFAGGAYASKLDESERKRTNALLRERAGDVTILPSSALVADPSDPSRLKAEFAAPDKLHMQPDGYRALANMIDAWRGVR